MLPTRAFKNEVTNYPQEPTLRIGKKVPKNAVNLAYYYNPTATDSEKVMTAEAPRSTVDHRVEEAYRYLHDRATNDDDQFPAYVTFTDEEGYEGKLGRQYVQWFPKTHVETKNVHAEKVIRVTDKNDVPKMFQYDDEYGFSGNLYLDAVSWSVCKWEKETTKTEVDYEVLDCELSYKEIFGKYVEPQQVNSWTAPPMENDTQWCRYIDVGTDFMIPSGGNQTVQAWIMKFGQTNHFEGATGRLKFVGISYEQVYKGDPENGEVMPTKEVSNTFNTPWANVSDLPDVDLTGDPESARDKIFAALQSKLNGEILNVLFKHSYLANYDTSNDNYDYTEIDNWLTMAKSEMYGNTGAAAIRIIESAKGDNSDIAIYLVNCQMELEDESKLDTRYRFKAKYKYVVSTRAIGGTYQYNVVANYQALKPDALKRIITTDKEVPSQYEGICQYTGLARKVWHTYDGMAYYRGAVTKGNAMGNVNPDGDDELLMFSDDEGYLRRPMEITDMDGNREIKNFYRVEADYVYITDVFKDGVACFYKYPLKSDIYDYRGPDENGFYEGDAVKMCTAAFKDIPDGGKYAVKLSVAEEEEINVITNGFQQETKLVPRRYHADLYSSFISGATDTFKGIYNAYNDHEEDNTLIHSGKTEDVYNYPFMMPGRDYTMEQVDIRTRCNKIRLPEPRRIKDTRHWVSFTYTVTAERKQVINGDGEIITPEEKITAGPFTMSILNRDYAVNSELKNFIGRGYIVSPIHDDVYASPMDIILEWQGSLESAPVAHYGDTDLIFSARVESTDITGSVNLTCNPDGSGMITAETTLDTGFYNEKTGLYNRKLIIDAPYYLEKGYIYPGFKVKCIDSRYIKVNAPREDGLLDSWYPLIQFGHYSQIMDQYGTHVKVAYTMPEYDTQIFSEKYGRPFIDIEKEPVTVLNSHMVKTKCFPLLITNKKPGFYGFDNESFVRLFKQIEDELFEIQISDISFSDGIIITMDAVSENDNLVCDYTYVEENYVYRGYWRNENDFVRLDLNPNQYHTYNDPGFTPSEVKPSKNLFNKVIYFFMKPTVIYEVSSDNDSLIYNLEDDAEIGEATLTNPQDTLYHQIDNSVPQTDYDIYIGSVYIRQNTSLHSTVLID